MTIQDLVEKYERISKESGYEIQILEDEDPDIGDEISGNDYETLRYINKYYGAMIFGWDSREQELHPLFEIWSCPETSLHLLDNILELWLKDQKNDK